MNSKHLSDEEIQNFLDNSQNTGRSETESHLSSCRACREAVEAYRTVFAGLRSKPQDLLSVEFTDTVMATLPEKSRPGRAYGILSAAGLAVILIAGLFITQQYIDLAPVGKTVAQSLMPTIDIQAPELLDRDFGTFSNIHKYNLWVIAGLVVLSLTIIDQIISKKKSMNNKLLSLVAF